VLLCILCGGIAAGLTIGLTSMDKVTVKIMRKCGDRKEQKQADQIEPLIRDKH